MFYDGPLPVTEEIQKQIQELEMEAARATRLENESWERSDTDGFLSQWAHRVTRDLCKRKIEVLKNGGVAPFDVLVDDATGEVIAEDHYRFPNKYAPWKGDDFRWKVDENRYGRRWIPVGSNSRIQKMVRLHEETRWFPATAETQSRGTGLSGTLWIEVVKIRK